jgi:hypothetical protein
MKYSAMKPRPSVGTAADHREFEELALLAGQSCSASRFTAGAFGFLLCGHEDAGMHLAV